jgi:hypothetical protein
LAKSFDLKSYARRGAEARLRELAEEAKQLLNVFPDLSASFDQDELPLNFILRRGARKPPRGGRRRSKMSAAQRKAVSARMKKYWAERRKAQAKVK